jgi:hypothetical protein
MCVPRSVSVGLLRNRSRGRVRHVCRATDVGFVLRRDHDVRPRRRVHERHADLRRRRRERRPLRHGTAVRSRAVVRRLRCSDQHAGNVSARFRNRRGRLRSASQGGGPRRVRPSQRPRVQLNDDGMRRHRRGHGGSALWRRERPEQPLQHQRGLHGSQRNYAGNMHRRRRRRNGLRYDGRTRLPGSVAMHRGRGRRHGRNVRHERHDQLSLASRLFPLPEPTSRG